jgi:hypothetical protein
MAGMPSTTTRHRAMPSRRRDPAQQTLFADGPARKGRVESAVDKAVRAAQKDQVVSVTLDAGAVALARTLARLIDQAARTLDPWSLARLSGELRAVLTSLRLDPVSRGGVRRDEFADLLATLARPTAGGDDDDAPMAHSPDA